MSNKEIKQELEEQFIILWDRIEKIGWFILGAGAMRMGWFGPDAFFGSEWGALIIGSVTLAASWVYQPLTREDDE